jgi:hypothetical protein
VHPWISGQLVDQYQRNARANALAPGRSHSSRRVRRAIGVRLVRWGVRLAL